MSKIHLTPKAASFVYFCAGLGVGALASALGLKKWYSEKYEKLSEQETEIIRTMYMDKLNEVISKEIPDREELAHTTSENHIEAFDMKKFQESVAEITRSRKYTTQEETESPIEDEEEEESELYAIPRELFGQPGYKAEYLTYYSDDVLLDREGHLMSVFREDHEDSLSIPSEIMEHIGEYIEDVVYCRDDNLKVDYEIRCANEPYSDDSESSEGLYDEEDD